MRRFTPWLAPGLLLAAGIAAAGDDRPKGAGVTVTASSDGFAVKSDDGDFKLQLKGLVQFDGRFYPSDQDDVLTDNFLVRRARPIFQGTVARYFDFNFTPDFGLGTAIIQDFYIDAKATRGFGLKVGKYKPPIGVEHLQSDAYLAFPERSFPSALLPNRDVGISAHGELAKGIVSYAVGVFDGTPDGGSVDLDTNDGKSLVGRLVVSPFKTRASAFSGLGLGVAASTEKQSGSPVAGYRTGGQSSFFSYSAGVAPSGTRTRFAPELTLFSGPVGLVAEYALSEGRLVKTTTTATTGPFRFRNDAWNVTATAFLTGDKAAFEGVSVKKPFDPAQHHWGALQLALRATQFNADEGTFARGFADRGKSASKATAWAIALNWYLNRNIKQSASFERTSFEGGAANGADRPAESVFIIRSQLSF